MAHLEADGGDSSRVVPLLPIAIACGQLGHETWILGCLDPVANPADPRQSGSYTYMGWAVVGR